MEVEEKTTSVMIAVSVTRSEHPSGKSKFDLAGLAYLRHLKLSLKGNLVDENRLFLLKRTLSRLS